MGIASVGAEVALETIKERETAVGFTESSEAESVGVVTVEFKTVVLPEMEAPEDEGEDVEEDG